MNNKINTFIKVGVIALRNEKSHFSGPIDLYIKTNQLEQTGLVAKDTLTLISKHLAGQYDRHIKEPKIEK